MGATDPSCGRQVCGRQANDLGRLAPLRSRDLGPVPSVGGGLVELSA